MIDLRSTFGMHEMEVAAVRVIELCSNQGTWTTPVCYEQMTTDTERVGFLHLLNGGWMTYLVYKRDWFVLPSFIARVKERPGVPKLKGLNTTEELVAYRTKPLTDFANKREES